MMSNKHPPFTIEWHKQCLAASIETENGKRRQLERLKAEILAISLENKFRQQQIDEAIKQGKTIFDPDRFMKKRRRHHD
jgi:hypothetical protein